MNPVRYLEKRIRGWLPQYHAATDSHQAAISLLRKHPLAIGLGIGMGVPEGIQWTLYFLGVVKNEGAFFAAQLIIIPVFITLIVLGYWLSKKAKAARTKIPPYNPSIKNEGWLPKESGMSFSRGKTSSKGHAAYVVGYGVGIAVCELLILSIYLLGWGNVEGSLSPIVNLFSSWFVSLLGTAVALIIGRQLSKKLQKRRRVAL